MQIRRIHLTPLRLALLFIVLATFVVAFFSLLVPGVSSIWSWLGSNHSLIIACFIHGC